MCWSEGVSLASFAYDASCLATLCLRRKKNDVKYAVILWGIVAQEAFQVLAWHLMDRGARCEMALVVVSVGAMISSQAIPLGIVAASVMGSSEGTAARHRHQVAALVAWAMQFFAVIVCVHGSGRWCIDRGASGHQVWICAQSLYSVGGFPLYVASFGADAVSILRGFRAVDLPTGEKRWMVRLGGLSAALVYGIYSATLEACSVWCWSAFALATYAVVRRGPRHDEPTSEQLPPGRL